MNASNDLPIQVSPCGLLFIYIYRIDDAPFSSFMDEYILYGMGGNQNTGMKEARRDRVLKPRIALVFRNLSLCYSYQTAKVFFFTASGI